MVKIHASVHTRRQCVSSWGVGSVRHVCIMRRHACRLAIYEGAMVWKQISSSHFLVASFPTLLCFSHFPHCSKRPLVSRDLSEKAFIWVRRSRGYISS